MKMLTMSTGSRPERLAISLNKNLRLFDVMKAEWVGT